jgi:hypothetical protein
MGANPRWASGAVGGSWRGGSPTISWGCSGRSGWCVWEESGGTSPASNAVGLMIVDFSIRSWVIASDKKIHQKFLGRILEHSPLRAILGAGCTTN